MVPFGALTGGGGFGPLFRASGGRSKKGNGHGYLGRDRIGGGRMDHLCRLSRVFAGPLRCVVALVALWVALASSAFADATVPIGSSVTGWFAGGGPQSPFTAVFPDQQSACNALAAIGSPTQTGTVNGTECDVYHSDGSFSGEQGLYPSVSAQCPPGSSPNSDGKTCTCASGASNGTSCTGHSCPPFGTTTPDDGSRYTFSGMGSGGGYCSGGCGYWPEAVATSGGVAEYSYGGGISTGQSCGANAAAGAPNPVGGSSGAGGSSGGLPDAAAQSGPSTQCTGATACSGQVNGTTVCVACGTPTTTSGTQSTSTPAPGSSQTASQTTSTTTTQGNPDGSTTTTTTTTTTGGSHPGTVVTTSTAPAGATGGSSGGGGVGTGGGTCTGTSCGSSTDSFGGSCTVAFSCDGDAVQCSIAMEQHQRDCMLFQPETQGGDLGDEAARGAQAKADGDVPSWSPANPANVSSTTMDFDSQIDQTNPFDSSCPADQVLALGAPFGSVTLPFSSWCPSLQLIGQLVLGVCLFAAAFIVLGK